MLFSNARVFVHTLTTTQQFILNDPIPNDPMLKDIERRRDPFTDTWIYEKVMYNKI